MYRRRILHLIQCGPATGGTVSHVTTQVEHQLRAGLTVAVIAASDGVLTSKCRAAGADVFVDSALLPQATTRRTEVAELFDIARTWAPDLVHSHLMHAGFVGRELSAERGVPHVYTQHMYTPVDAFLRTARVTASSPDIIAVARFARDALERYFSGEARVHYVPNGVDIPEETDFVLEQSRGPHLLYCGRLSPEKGADTLLLAFAEISRACPNAVLHIVGAGPDEALLQRIITALGLDSSVKLYGSTSGALHANTGADLVIVPSRGEAASLVILEAMASRIPIVATNVGGIPELLRDGVDAMIVEADDPGQLALAVLAILRSDDRGSTTAANARARYEAAYTAAAMVERTIAVYRDVLQRDAVDK